MRTKRIAPFTIAPKRIKYLEINLIMEGRRPALWMLYDIDEMNWRWHTWIESCNISYIYIYIYIYTHTHRHKHTYICVCEILSLLFSRWE